ncbi:Transcriptional activator spt7 [Exophiala xenobiotica]|uniref:Transcriptional activator spt7 n=1 Tax=Lithohypha guttulata TaxID=1690604 RepID=A0ABR0JY20_9EURO|nr:Transcriptional activator spt7 [Lithohypha guttulata]KAK5310735.1 Transcriptional activator spt7 [Exophiala xenobiotica]
MATWLPASSSHNHNHKPPDDDYPSGTAHHSNLAKDMFNGLLKAPSRSHTPTPLSARLRALNAASASSSSQSGNAPDPEPTLEDDPLVLKFKALYEESEARIASLFDKFGNVVVPEKRKLPESCDATQPSSSSAIPDIIAPESQSRSQPSQPTSKKRKLDDDYDDYDDEDDDEEADGATSPLKHKTAKVQIVSDRHASPVPRPVPPSRPSSEASKSDAAKQKQQQEKPEDARKKLEEAKRLEVETVKNMSRHFFFTLENDRDAMLDQQRLDEAERRAEAEADGTAKGQHGNAPTQQQGSLSSANLGASSLTLKNLIARIDQYRPTVQASESELRALMSEVRKNRSKWASEDKVGQEELYEAAEKVLNELKAQTEHSSPFLQPVKKKDAPDYHVIIKAPIDLGTMTKKLKQLAYKSKQDFVDDLHLTWTNCLKYNSALDHPMRKHALFMRKETDKLVPLIPDIVIKDRAEMEAEERKQRIANGDFDDNAEDSDDDQPIMASRGRAAPGQAKKTSKTSQASRKTNVVEGTPIPDSKPSLSQINAMSNGARADSEADVGSQGHSTPPPGNLTPGFDRGAGSVVDGASEMPDSEVPGLPFAGTPPEVEDEEYRLWKQKTKKERAQVAAARHKLFRGDKLNADEDALLRSKAGMRRWQRLHDQVGAPSLADANDAAANQSSRGPTLAEGLEPQEEESMLPDYYDPVAAVPDLNPNLRWETDAEGNVIEQNADYLHLYPQGQFTAPESKLSHKMSDNMRQIQETRKIVSKIGVVKQMQLQSQVYQNQFTKYEPAPFYEADVKNHVMTDEGPLMAPWVCKAAMTRSIGEIFFHAGFEEFQPSAIESIADMAGTFFHTLCSNLSTYLTEEKIPMPTTTTAPVASTQATQSQPNLQRAASQLPSQETSHKFVPPTTSEEALLHTLQTSGLSLNDLHSYANEEIDRTSAKLNTMYDRMRSHYADLLKPAMNDDTATGSGSFETGEQYTSGDFADDLGEDFFGFKELGLDKEFGLVNLSVPLHLLHNRLSSAAKQQQGDTGDPTEKLFVPPPPYPRLNVENIEGEVGLVREFFKKRLRENGDRPLPEDLDLPVKQRKGYGRARVPASGKIGDGKVGVSPQKKAPAPSKAAPANKLQLTNGIKNNDKKKAVANGVDGDASMLDGDADETGPPTPSQRQDEDDGSPEKQTQSQTRKTPSKQLPLKARPSDARKNSGLPDGIDHDNDNDPDGEANGDDDGDTTMNMNGDFSSFVNGMDSPPPSAHGNEHQPVGEKKKKGKGKKQQQQQQQQSQTQNENGNVDGGMISPESL